MKMTSGGIVVPAGPVVIPFANAGTVKLSGLARDVNEYLLWMLCQTAGEVKNCKIVYDAMGYPTGGGFVDMGDHGMKVTCTKAGTGVRILFFLGLFLRLWCLGLVWCQIVV